MVIHDALGPPSGARGIVQRKAFPFILRHNPREIWRAAGYKVFVKAVPPGGGDTSHGVGDLDQDWGRGGHQGDRGLCQRDELAVDQGDFGPAVVKDIGDGVGVQPGIDRVHDRPAGRGGK